MTVRDEVARDTALLTLVPLLLLVPVLLMVVAAIVERAFRPIVQLSVSTDGLGDTRIVPLDERDVPLEVLPLLQAVNRLMGRLARSIEHQRRFVSDAAHELRTPIATLTVQAENVLRVELPQEARSRMSILRQGLSRMQSLVEQLLDFARVQGAVAQAPRAFDLAALVRMAIEESLPAACAKRIDLGCVRLDAATVSGDPAHAYALVRNAVDNAVRYTPRGGSVDVSLAVDDTAACFTVEDTGPGIAPADIEKVFEPFVRIPGSQSPGSGLGLAIARTAADTLGGRISLGRRKDGGPGLRFTYRQAVTRKARARGRAPDEA
jgi:signal transduction histidine kinase